MLHEVDVLIHHVPYLLDASAIESAVAQYLGCPSAFGFGEEVEGIAKTGGSHVAFIYILTVALVDAYTVGYLHYTALDALQFIARAGQLYQ